MTDVIAYRGQRSMMSCLSGPDDNGVYQVQTFALLSTAIDEAIELATSEGKEIKFEFNGVIVRVTSTSDPEDIWRQTKRAISDKVGEVGP